ncbi:uncharacterized protein STEHIDRAFT_160203 [Stereum hirsutum FP-91666 SS1]|uniref:uncharacterized protein n=1 Tax=Stereum hirsutum (strain FP-91666) TaxID=721885 RepID=UPI0004449550|nr:uncharacterized protein STEHIDRAFT_160203 [Stereum hirsutum FP-91666 SS1]EIM83628.1 hypothetical protein STEHIDRAFT_160203 [Stereum hirsutum FP-91666 SS1]
MGCDGQTSCSPTPVLSGQNASILNASALPSARLSIHSFRHAFHLLDLTYSVFLTQNDHTTLLADMAAKLPATMLNSGLTNSMHDSAFLVKELKGMARDRKETEERETISVVVIGGTTADCGMLLVSGLPRRAAAITETGGVFLQNNIDIGGGPVGPRESSSSTKVTICPDYAQKLVYIGDPSLLAASSEFTLPASFMLWTSAEDVTVLLVGSSAVLVPVDEGDSASAEFAGWRMRLGLVGTMNTMVLTVDKSIQTLLDEICAKAVDDTLRAFCLAVVGVVNEFCARAGCGLALVWYVQYVANTSRVIVQEVGIHLLGGGSGSVPDVTFLELIMTFANSKKGSNAPSAPPSPNRALTSPRVCRAVVLCKSRSELDNVIDVIADKVGVKESAKGLFKCSIVGKVVQRFSGLVKVPFKNENVLAAHVDVSGKEPLLASAPDPILVLDTNFGEAIGIPEYLYGLLCTIIGITASERWTSMERGIEIVGPKASGIDDVGVYAA